VLSLSNELNQKGHEVTIVSGSQTIEPLIAPDKGIRIVKSPGSRYYEKKLAVPFFCCHFLLNSYDRIIVFFADFGEEETLKFVGKFKKLNTVLYLCYPYSSVPHRYNSMIKAGWRTSINTILADADWIATEAAELFGRIVKVVPVGTNPDRFKPDVATRIKMRKQFRLSDEEFVLLHVGALEERKGVHRVIEALRFLENIPVKYVILGSGPDQAMLMEMVQKYYLASKVIFAGTTSELERYYQMADIFIMVPDSEANSVASIEAMSSALPLIVSNDGGYAESLPPDGAIFVDQNKTESIVEAISHLAKNEKLRLEMGHTNRKHVIEHLSWEAISESFVTAIS
jgi:glycosyltransferase involved in cell wall biosynthesis